MRPQIWANRAVAELDRRSPTFKKSGGQTLPEAYPPFNAMLYSLDGFLPFVDLNQKSLWWLRPRKPFNNVYWLYETYFFGHTPRMGADRDSRSRDQRPDQK
jgi:hypothetical protein